MESVTGIAIVTNFVLNGSKPRTWSHSATWVQGTEGGIKNKWDLHLESETSSTQICVNGEVSLPNLPTWKLPEIRNSHMSYRYVNTIGYGSSSCEESTIKITGTSEVSEKQKTYSRESPEAKRLAKLTEMKVPLIGMSELYEKVRDQATCLLYTSPSPRD